MRSRWDVEKCWASRNARSHFASVREGWQRGLGRPLEPTPSERERAQVAEREDSVPLATCGARRGKREDHSSRHRVSASERRWRRERVRCRSRRAEHGAANGKTTRADTE